MPRPNPPYRPDFTTETTPALHLLSTSWLALLTTILALLLLACAFIFLLRLCVLWDRRLARAGIVGGVPREERLLRVCVERGKRVCQVRGVWDVGVRGGPKEYVDESPRRGEGGKKIRFVPGAEVIPCAEDSGGKGKGKSCERESSSSSCSLRTSEDRSVDFPSEMTGARGGDEQIPCGSSAVGSVTKRVSADWVGGEEPVLFFGGGSWMRRVRNRSETWSGSVMEVGGGGSGRVSMSGVVAVNGTICID